LIHFLPKLLHRLNGKRYSPYHTLAEEVNTFLPEPTSRLNAKRYRHTEALAHKTTSSLPKPTSRRRGVELLLFDSKTFSSKKKKKKF